MVGILLMTHAPLGQAFIAACAHVFRGPTERFEAIDVVADQDLAEVQKLASEAICRLDDGSGVLVQRVERQRPTRAFVGGAYASVARRACQHP